MLIKYFGTAGNFFADGLWGSGVHVPHVSDASTSKKLVVEPTDAGINAIFTGVDFELFAGNIPIGGTITGLNFDKGNTRVAEISDVRWDVDPYFSALGIAPTDTAPLTAFMNTGPVTIDARNATSALVDFQDHFKFTANLTIKGSAFGDTVVGGSGNDRVFGNKGNDIFQTGAGDDIVKGGRGHDVFHNDEGADAFFGGRGIDTLIDTSFVWARDLGVVIVNLTTGIHRFSELTNQDDTLIGIENYTFNGGEDVIVRGSNISNTLKSGGGDDRMSGLGGDDRLFGRAGSDVIKGNDGDDKIFGGSGRDSIQGGAGNDIIFAGHGRDRIRGGTGEDVFVFNDIALEHTNVIVDFDDGLDKIRVTRHSGFDAIKISAVHNDADTLIELSGGTRIILKDVASELIDINDFDLL